MKNNKIVRFILLVLLCESAGVIGSFFTFSSVQTWYPTLEKPFFNPPSWVFGPVWTALYFLMGVSLFLVWGKKKADLRWFWFQFVLNTLWSIIFFGLKNPLLAYIVIVGMWIGIVFTIKSFRKVSNTAAYLLIPYLVWVTFASFLNLAIVLLN